MMSVREEPNPDVRAELVKIVRALRPPRTPASAKAVATPAVSLGFDTLTDGSDSVSIWSKTMIGRLGRRRV